MPNLLAMSFEGELTPSFELRCLHPGARRPDGWGLAHYPAGEPAASVLKEPAPAQTSERTALIKAKEHLESATFLLHIRAATWGALSEANTQPFSRIWGGREWLFAHSGSLQARPTLAPDSIFEPVGSTDSEVIFCDLMNRIAQQRWRSLQDADPELLRQWLASINELGTLNVTLTDGRDLCVYTDRTRSGFFAWELRPPYETVVFGDADVEVDLTRRGAKSRKGWLLSSRELASTPGSIPADWRLLQPGHLFRVRQGVIEATAAPAQQNPSGEAPLAPAVKLRLGRTARPQQAEVKRYTVTHRTAYQYAAPVERSHHLLRLAPKHDRLQRVISHDISISVDCQARDYEDVFGNFVRRLRVDTPYSEMIIEARSEVELLDTDPLSFRPLRARTTIPLVWMPWHRHMLNPYLHPPELPESELAELTEYAMSFVERNDYNLLDTLLDLNWTLFHEYKYEPGSTTLATTAFQVYSQRTGVCQDFANLFICLARLLGVPARYACGYVYARPTNPNQRQAEASHAWVQVYLAEVGWKGFDPTNGVLTQTEHIRVATGRVYGDATPTSGVIYAGGGAETLSVDVRVDPLP